MIERNPAKVTLDCENCGGSGWVCVEGVEHGQCAIPEHRIACVPCGGTGKVEYLRPGYVAK